MIGVLPVTVLLLGLTADAAQPAGSPERSAETRPAVNSQDHEQQETAVRHVVADYVAARERRDADAIRALFTEDADQLVSSGEWRRGREEIVRGTLASSERTGGTRTIAIETVRFPADGVAIADGRYEIANAQGEARRMWTSFVMTRGPGRWRIAAIRNMLPAPPAR